LASEDEEDDDDDGSEPFDYLVFILRLLFMATMAGLALWGHHVLAVRAEAEADAITAARATGGHDSGDDFSLAECAGRDEDLVAVCWWIVVIEGCAAAIAAGVAIAQAVAAVFGW